MRSTIHAIPAAFCLLALSTAAVPASVVYQTSQTGDFGSGLASAPPGNVFNLDFRPSISDTAPYDLGQVNFIFDAFRPYEELKIKLDIADTIFCYIPVPQNHEQIAYCLYDPILVPNPGSGPPNTPTFTLLTQEWRDELADGVLSGRLWVTNPSVPVNQYQFAMGAMFAVEFPFQPAPPFPEPAGGVVCAILAAISIARRRRTMT